MFFGFLLVIGFLGCNKEESNTKLELTVVDLFGKPVAGVTVKLFEFRSDFENDNSVLKTRKTNDNGIVTFRDLTNDTYYFRATKGCLNNYTNNIEISSLKIDSINTVEVIVQETCHLTVYNNSNNRFQVFLYGYESGYMTEKTTKTFYNSIPVGTVFLRALQTGILNNNPIKLTFYVEGKCDSTVSIVIP